MKVDIPGDHSKYLTDPTHKIPPVHLRKVCRISEGSCACRYISKTVVLGYICVKNTPLKGWIDQMVDSNPKWRAKGNNCDGFGDYAKKEKTAEGSQENS